ncbi:MAG: 4Fe-4S dicluster domain-containing protein [Candidatus Methanofastidiosia archaeon]
MIKIEEEYCKGCSYCIFACPSNTLEKSDKVNFRGIAIPKINESLCTKCHLCELACPDFAISVEED